LARRDLGPRVTAYGHGHRVGVLLENRPDFFLHWFALNALGVSLVPLNPDLRAAELEYLIGHSEMVAALAIPSRHSDLSAAAKAIGRSIAVFGRAIKLLRSLRHLQRRARRIATASVPCSTLRAPRDGPRAA
jgi:acyl-CoA synthetase (AMP-forming)/AMP-acid ligase II